MSRSIASLGLMIVVLSGCGWLVQENATDLSASTSPELRPTPELTYENITLLETGPDGRILWKLTATVAKSNTDQTSASLDAVTGEFFDQDGHAVKTRAEIGSVYTEEKRFELTGNVQIQSPFYQFQLVADRVDWYPDEIRLVALDNVVVSQIDVEDPNREASDQTRPAEIELVPAEDAIWVGRGEQLTTTFDTQQVILSNRSDQPIEATLKDPQLNLTATTLQWDILGETLVAQTNIEVQYPDQAAILNGDSLTTQLAEDRLILRGNTLARSLLTQQQLQAEQLEWDLRSPIIEATGEVSYEQPNQNLFVTGPAATLNWQANTVAVRGGSTVTQIQVP